jgi:hypothetical protein
VRGSEATRSFIEARIPVQRGEWKFDLNFGPDWDSLFGANIDDTLILAALVTELTRVPTVSAPTIGDFEITRDPVTRFVLIPGTVRSDNGETLDVAFASGT